MNCVTKSIALSVTLLAIGLSGCGSGANPAPTAAPATTTSESAHDHHDHSSSDMDQMKAELAKLAPEDAAAAEKQHVCPVTDKMLGTMGAPKKVDVKGQAVWICCDGCRKELLANSDRYLAKLKK